MLLQRLTSTWYSLGGPSTSESGHNSLFFDGVTGSIKTFLSYFENVATRGKNSDERAVMLFSYLAGEAFDFYYDEYALDGELSADAINYENVKASFIVCFEKTEFPEEKIQRATASFLDSADFRSSLRGMDTLYQKQVLTKKPNLDSFVKLSWNTKISHSSWSTKTRAPMKN